MLTRTLKPLLYGVAVWSAATLISLATLLYVLLLARIYGAF